MIPREGRIAAIDWGEVRLGLALSDETQFLASPLETLERRIGKRFPMKRFIDLLTARAPVVGIVVGLPLTGEGDEGPSATAARELAEKVHAISRLPIEMVDERMTTARALREIHEQGGSTKGRKADVDALAASVILQHYLDGRRHGTFA